jgi:uncharacterized protein YjbJ (UPF0337 family)
MFRDVNLANCNHGRGKNFSGAGIAAFAIDITGPPDGGQDCSLNDPAIAELGPHRAADIAAARTAREWRRLSIPNRRQSMNWDQIEVNWMLFKDKIRNNWVKLTDEDVTRIAGRRKELVGRLRTRYGFAKAEAEREIEAWVRSQRNAA